MDADSGDIAAGSEAQADTPQFGESYFRDYFGSEIPYDREDPHWRGFFGAMADRIVADIGPRTSLDAGCAIGMLVEALTDRGVDSRGIDVSAYAIGKVREDLRDKCSVGSLAEPIEGRYDLVTCIEVLEHIEPSEVEAAIDNLCSITDEILFSSTALEYRDPTHINIRPIEYWAEQFARRGFIRDVTYDASYIAFWAVRFRRRAEPLHRVVGGYERMLWNLVHEKGERDPVMLHQAQEIGNLRREYEAAMDQLAPTREALAAVEADRDALQARVVALRTRLDDTRAKLVELRDREAVMRGQVQEMRRSLANRIARGIVRRRRGARPPDRAQ